jgi:hypothetical protein
MPHRCSRLRRRVRTPSTLRIARARREYPRPLPFVAPRREEGAGDGESAPGLVRSVRKLGLFGWQSPSFRSATRGRGRGWRVWSRLSSNCSAPFLSLRREEGVGDGESAPGLARIVRPLPFAPARGRGRGWRVRSRLSSNCSAPFLSLRREEGVGDGESGRDLVRTLGSCRTPEQPGASERSLYAMASLGGF